MLGRQSQIAVIETIWSAKPTGPLRKESTDPCEDWTEHVVSAHLMSAANVILVRGPSEVSVFILFETGKKKKQNNVFTFDVLSTIPKTSPLPAHQIIIYIIIHMCVLAGRAWLPHIHQTFSSEHQLRVLQSNAIWTLPCDTFRFHTLGLSPSGLFHTVSKSHVVNWQLYFLLVNYKSDSQGPCFGSD